jgi:hypothetical protein
VAEGRLAAAAAARVVDNYAARLSGYTYMESETAVVRPSESGA